MSLTIHVALSAVFGALLGLCFLQEPVLGDDLTYWSFARRVHELGLNAWRTESFYDLRWPVWAVCWALQGIIGANLASYWAVPLVYLGAGAALAFWLGQRVMHSLGAAWAGALLFVFHPFLDAVVSCPMPDLSEAVWGAATMLAWWKMMEASKAARAWLFAALTGLGVFILEANRITGVFIVPLLVLATALFFRGRFYWLLAAGLVALALYGLECWFYHHLFGDWLHDFTANTGNKGAKGTEAVGVWLLPFRFADTFWRDPLAPCYSISALAGIWFALRKGGVFGRVLVLWFTVLLLEYSCAPQSLSPYRPLVRDGARFLSCLAIPMSLLAALGLRELWTRLDGGRLIRHPLAPLLIGLVAMAFLTAATKRKFFDPGFVSEFREYLAAVPDGTTVFTHASMRDIVNLVEPGKAGSIRWVTYGDILHEDPLLELEAAKCDEIWYERTLAWLYPRLRLQRTKSGAQPTLASYFAEPEREWRLVRSIVKAGSPELVFYRKRKVARPPIIYPSEAPEWSGLLPSLPATWQRGRDPSVIKSAWAIPPSFRGQLVRLQFDASSATSEALFVRLRFKSEIGRQGDEMVLRPYLYPGGGTDFFALQIPEASTTCDVRLQFLPKTERVTFTRLSAVAEDRSAP